MSKALYVYELSKTKKIDGQVSVHRDVISHDERRIIKKGGYGEVTILVGDNQIVSETPPELINNEEEEETKEGN